MKGLDRTREALSGAVAAEVLADRALALLGQGFSCSEAVAGAFASELGVDADICVRAGSGFAGGLALRGRTCGVVLAAVFLLGLRYGPVGEMDDVDAARRGSVMRNAELFLEEFERAHGSLDCCTLCEGGELEPSERARLLRKVGTPAVYVRSAVGMLCGQCWRGAS